MYHHLATVHEVIPANGDIDVTWATVNVSGGGETSFVVIMKLLRVYR